MGMPVKPPDLPYTGVSLLPRGAVRPRPSLVIVETAPDFSGTVLSVNLNAREQQ